MKYLTIILVLFLLIGCRGQKTISTTETSKLDSSVDKEVIISKDTLIGFKGDTLKSNISTIHDTIYWERSGRAQNLIVVKDHKVYVQTTCDSLSALITKVQRDYSHYQESHKDSINTVFKEITKVEYKTPKFWLYSGIFGLLCLVYFGVRIYMKFAK